MSTIQFNLLPDVKETYINTQRNRKTVVTICFLTSAISIAIFILVLFSVDGVQKAQLSKANSDINNAQQQLKGINNLPKILTVQNQLQTLSTLHQSKVAASRIFTYMPRLTPASATISSMTLDFSANTLSINGIADSQATINTFIDTLKFAVYQANGDDSQHLAFSNVTLGSFGITPGKATFTISATFDPLLFANPLQQSPILTVKNQVTTRSVLDDPATLFSAPANNTTGTKK